MQYFKKSVQNAKKVQVLYEPNNMPHIFFSFHKNNILKKAASLLRHISQFWPIQMQANAKTE